MSIKEAAELIVQSGGIAESGDTVLLEMGEPVKIRDLAENMILLAGLSVRNDENPHGDIGIEVTGIREGEKMYEELFYDPSLAQPTRHPKIMRAPKAIRLRSMCLPASRRYVLPWKAVMSMRFARYCSTL